MGPLLALCLVAAGAPRFSLRDLAALLGSLGARDALNLDGGGSTALTVAGDTPLPGLLPVPNHLAIVIASRNFR